MGYIRWAVCLLMASAAAGAQASVVEVNGVEYECTGNYAKVDGYTSRVPSVVEIPETVDFYGNTCKVVGVNAYAMHDCRTLEKITLPATVVSVGPGAWSGCTSLESLPDLSKVTSLGADMFRGCTSLTEVELEMPTVPAGMFARCTGLRRVSLPELHGDIWERYQEIGDSAFVGCTSLARVELSQQNQETLGARCFKECTALTGIEFLSSGNVLGAECFKGCTSLESVSTPEWDYEGYPQVSIVFLGVDCFQDCTSLSQVTSQKENFSLAPGCFKGCVRLRELEGHWGGIPDEAFCGCTALEKVQFSCGVGKYAFEGCISLTQAGTVDEYHSWPWGGDNHIGQGAFLGCAALETLKQDEIKSIQAEAFSGCKKLKTCELGFDSDFSFIGSNAFMGCDSLETMGLPTYWDYRVAEKAFAGWTGLRRLNLGGAWSVGDSAFVDCRNMEHLVLNNDQHWRINYVPAHMCQGCSSLRTIDLAYVESVGEGAFAGCPLDEVKNTFWLRTIGRGAFDTATPWALSFGNMSANTNVDIAADNFTQARPALAVQCRTSTPPTVMMPVFNTDVFSQGTLEIPVGSMDNYIYDYFWNQFLTITEKDFSYIGVDQAIAEQSYELQGRELRFKTGGVPYVIYDVRGQVVKQGESVRGTVVELPRGISVVSAGGTTRKVWCR